MLGVQGALFHCSAAEHLVEAACSCLGNLENVHFAGLQSNQSFCLAHKVLVLTI